MQNIFDFVLGTFPVKRLLNRNTQDEACMQLDNLALIWHLTPAEKTDITNWCTATSDNMLETLQKDITQFKSHIQGIIEHMAQLNDLVMENVKNEE